MKFGRRNKRREIGIEFNSPWNPTDFFIVVIVAVPCWAYGLNDYRASSLSLSINKLYWFWRSRQMDWPLLASSLVNPICPCGGKTTKKQKCIVSSVLLPIRISYTRYYRYYRFRAELRNSIFLYNHKDALVEGKSVLRFLARSLSNSDNNCTRVSIVTHFIFENL